MNSIFDLLPKTPNDIYFDPLFRQCVETYLPNLKSASTNRNLLVQPTEADKYEGDLAGLLLMKKVPPEHVWIVMRVNGYRSSKEYDGKIANFVLPSPDMINMIVQRYKTSHTVL